MIIKPLINKKTNGLSFYPTLEPDISDVAISLPSYTFDYQENGKDNSQRCLDLVYRLSQIIDPIGGILEIGCAAYEQGYTFTNKILYGKAEPIKYLGVDLAPKDIKNWGTNVFTIQANSKDQKKIRTSLKEIGIKSLSLLFIDGNHSVEFALNDWQYIDLLNTEGFVIIHDTNSHPGPLALMASIDRNIFEIYQPFENVLDHGLGIICFKHSKINFKIKNILND